MVQCATGFFECREIEGGESQAERCLPFYEWSRQFAFEGAPAELTMYDNAQNKTAGRVALN